MYYDNKKIKANTWLQVIGEIRVMFGADKLCMEKMYVNIKII